MKHGLPALHFARKYPRITQRKQVSPRSFRSDLVLLAPYFNRNAGVAALQQPLSAL